MKVMIDRVQRSFLVQVAEASSGADNPELKAYIEVLQARGQHTEATQDEIERFSNLLDVAEQELVP